MSSQSKSNRLVMRRHIFIAVYTWQILRENVSVYMYAADGQGNPEIC